MTGKYRTESMCFSVVLWAASVSMAHAEQESLIRILACEGSDARTELYLPNSVIGNDSFLEGKIASTVDGIYILDLTDAEKGKIAEPVHVTLSKEKKAIIVDQYTRKLKPTVVPLAGGKVSFDNRFATDLKCEPFGG